jgi:hypothetical protein
VTAASTAESADEVDAEGAGAEEEEDGDEEVFSTSTEPVRMTQPPLKRPSFLDRVNLHPPDGQRRYGPYFEDGLGPFNVTARVGSTVLLDCRIGMLQDKTVRWINTMVPIALIMMIICCLCTFNILEAIERFIDKVCIGSRQLLMREWIFINNYILCFFLIRVTYLFIKSP